jgi:hypothetical protein
MRRQRLDLVHPTRLRALNRRIEINHARRTFVPNGRLLRGFKTRARIHIATCQVNNQGSRDGA